MLRRAGGNHQVPSRRTGDIYRRIGQDAGPAPQCSVDDGGADGRVDQGGVHLGKNGRLGRARNA